jgi:hypothetical protein
MHNVSLYLTNNMRTEAMKIYTIQVEWNEFDRSDIQIKIESSPSYFIAHHHQKQLFLILDNIIIILLCKKSRFFVFF